MNMRQIIKGYFDNVPGSDSKIRKDKKEFILHIPYCKITYKPCEASIKIPRISHDHLIVVKNDTLFKLWRTKFPEYDGFDKSYPIYVLLDYPPQH